MVVYRVGYYTESNSSQGFEWFTGKREADKSLSDFKKKAGFDFDAGRSSVDAFEFHLSKKGVIDLLNVVAEHPDNG